MGFFDRLFGGNSGINALKVEHMGWGTIIYGSNAPLLAKARAAFFKRVKAEYIARNGDEEEVIYAVRGENEWNALFTAYSGLSLSKRMEDMLQSAITSFNLDVKDTEGASEQLNKLRDKDLEAEMVLVDLKSILEALRDPDAAIKKSRERK